MKTRYKILFSALVLLHSGCSDFVDLNPPTIVRQDQYFKTQSDFTAAVNGLYSSLRGYYANFYQFAELPSDNTEANGYNLASADLDQLTWLTNTSSIQSLWLNSYSTIARANIILDRIDAVTMDAVLKEQYKGEAKFVRALMYFNLVQFFGEVPLPLKEVQTEEEAYTYVRENVGKVYSQIQTDLLAAISTLPADYDAANKGKVTKGAAMGLLGKVYITNKQFAESAAILKTLVESNTYALLEKYEDVFRVDNPFNKEILFSVQYLGNGNGEGSNFSISFAPFGSGTDITSGGNPTGSNQGTLDLFNAFEAGDNRKNVAIMRYPSTGDPYTRKFLDKPIAANEGNNDWPVLRYADVLLMYAEALNETGAADGVLTPLNAVRARAGLAALPAGSQEQLRDLIQKERRVELCFEGHRWFDLLRTRQMLPVMSKYKEMYEGKAYLVEYYEVDERKYLFPIPFRERSLNPSLTQNNGYN
jgi:hypothetical protein